MSDFDLFARPGEPLARTLRIYESSPDLDGSVTPSDIDVRDLRGTVRYGDTADSDEAAEFAFAAVDASTVAASLTPLGEGAYWWQIQRRVQGVWRTIAAGRLFVSLS